MKHFDKEGGYPLTVKWLDMTPPASPCPRCGRGCRRRDTAERTLMDLGLDGPVLLLVTVGVYRCAGCRRAFRFPLTFAPPGGHYTYRAREKCRVSVDEDKMPFRLVVRRVVRDFHLRPALSTVHRWWRAEYPDYDQTAEYQDFVVGSFSGVLCVDGVHDGEFCVLLATDPLANLLVGYEVASGETEEAVEGFFQRLRAWGIEPLVVDTDGHKVYRQCIQRIFKAAKHQRCLFHVMQDFVKALGEQVLAYRRSFPKPGKRPRGRPRKGETPRPDPAREIWHARRRFLTRPEHLSEEQQRELERLLAQHPRLQALRDFLLDLFGLFTKPQFLFTREERGRFYDEFVSLHRDEPELLALFMKLLPREEFVKVTLFWEYENLNGTNNHVERTGRDFRKRQKSHYRLRAEASIRALWNHRLAWQACAPYGRHEGRERVELKSRCPAVLPPFLGTLRAQPA